MSHVFAGYHVVFVTKNRQNVIPLSERRTLYNYLYGVLTRFGCTTFRINGMGDHVHLAFDLNPRYALSDVVRDLKRGSSIAMGKEGKFPHFDGWARGFFGCSFSPADKDRIVAYITNQEEHHAGKALEAELEWLSVKAEIKFILEDYK